MLPVAPGGAARGRRRSRAGVHAARRRVPRDAVHPRPADGGSHRGRGDQHRPRHGSQRGLRRRQGAALGDGPEHRRPRRRRRVHRDRRAWTPATAVLGTYRVNVFNGEVTEWSDTDRGRAPVAGTSLAVDQSGTFEVCTGLPLRRRWRAPPTAPISSSSTRSSDAVSGRRLAAAVSRRAALRPRRVRRASRTAHAGRGRALPHGHRRAAAGRGHPERGQPPGRLPRADPGDQARPEERPLPPDARDAVPVQPGLPVRRAGDPARAQARPELRRGAQQPRADLSLAGASSPRPPRSFARRWRTSRTRRRNTPPTTSARRPTC